MVNIWGNEKKNQLSSCGAIADDRTQTAIV